MSEAMMDSKKIKMINCKEVLANLSAYVDNEASAELRVLLEEHLAWCRRCQVVFDTTGRMMRIVHDAEAFEVPLAVSARLFTRLEKELSED
jgi:predicted anti-sigma-YlaC factor YlaD